MCWPCSLVTVSPRPRSETYRFLEDILIANGVSSVGALRELLNVADIELLLKVMRYRFHPGQIRIIDDLLLKKFGQAHIEATAARDAQPPQSKRRRQLKRKLDLMQQAHIAESGVETAAGSELGGVDSEA